jgi:hypothetical protein
MSFKTRSSAVKGTGKIALIVEDEPAALKIIRRGITKIPQPDPNKFRSMTLIFSEVELQSVKDQIKKLPKIPGRKKAISIAEWMKKAVMEKATSSK